MTSSGDGVDVDKGAPAIHTRGGLLLMGVRVMPSAARTEVRGVYGDRLKVAVNAPPEAGRANARLTQALATWFGLREEQVVVHAGHGSRDKVIAFSGIMEATLRSRLNRLLQDPERAR